MLEKSSNPVFSGNVFNSQTFSYAQQNTMTIKGTANKSLTLLGIILVSALVTWKMAFAGNGLVMPLMIGGLIVGFFVSVAEPGLLVLANQVGLVTSGEISGLTILLVVSIGLAILLRFWLFNRLICSLKRFLDKLQSFN